MAAPRGRGGRGGFGQNLCRPHDIFRQRKQNTSRPPSMHVDDFVAAEFKDITTPLGLLPPKRPPKSSPKPPTRGLFTGSRGRATFHSQTRFFTPPQPKGVLLSGMFAQLHTDILRKKKHFMCLHGLCYYSFLMAACYIDASSFSKSLQVYPRFCENYQSSDTH